jgi:hypothetical protein
LRQCLPTKAIIVLLCCLLPVEAKASDLNIFSNTNDFEGSTVEFSNPDGVSCRMREGESPSITAGVGVSRGPVIPGAFAGGRDDVFFYDPAEIAPVQPVAGVILRIPFGGRSSRGCDDFIAIESAMARQTKAQELFDLGVISQEQLEEISEKAFAVLNDF